MTFDKQSPQKRSKHIVFVWYIAFKANHHSSNNILYLIPLGIAQL